jgi:YD repeat-containing protein
VFDSLGGWQVVEGQSLTFIALAVDPGNPRYEPPQRAADGSLVTISDEPRTVTITPARALPDGATFDADTWQFHWTPQYGQAGTTNITFRATDPGGGTPLSSTVTVPITVLALNRPPAIVAQPNVTVARDGTSTITLKATDPQGNKLVLSLENESPGLPLPPFMTFVDNGDGTGTLTVAPHAGDRGDYPVAFTARDNLDGKLTPLTSRYVFVVTVTSPNEPPVFAPAGDAVAVIGQTSTLPLVVSDKDQDALTYTVSGLPGGATVVPGSIYGHLSLVYTPVAADAAVYTATVTATDDGNGGAAAPLRGSVSFQVVVRAADQAPTLGHVADQTFSAGNPASLLLTATDPENDSISYTATGLPAGASLDIHTGLLTWIPGFNQTGSYAVTFIASDGDLSSSQAATLTVQRTPRAPVFVPVNDQTTRAGTELDTTIVAADPDGQQVKLSVVGNLPNGALLVPATGLFQWTPDFGQAGDYLIKLRAANPDGLTATTSFTVHVAQVDRPPLMSTSDHNFLIGVTESFSILATNLTAGTVLSYSALDLPEGATVNSHTGIVTWTPGPGQAGTYTPLVTASDGQSASRQTIVLRASLEPVPPSVRIELTPSFPGVPGQAVLVHPVAAGLAAITSLKLYADGVLVPLDDKGRATITPNAPGRIALHAVAVDADGTVGTADLTLKTRDPANTVAPDVAFAGGTDGGYFTDVADIQGLVSSANLDTWTLSIALGTGGATLPASAFAQLAQGTASVSGTLGHLDTGAIANGIYTLRLNASDMAGRTSTVFAVIEVNTHAKTAAYQRTETDLSLTLDGVPFSLTRVYDSAATAFGGGDQSFGQGWSWSPRDVGLQTNAPATGREAQGVYAPFVDGTRLYLTLPTGVREGFSFTPTAENVGPVTFYHPAWTADDPALGWTLQPLQDTLLRQAGATYYDAGSGVPYNPAGTGGKYLLTAPGGTTSYVIDPAQGITEIRTAQGTLTVTDGGVTAADGSGVRFIRDTSGHITRAQAPDGTTITYTYDPSGQLIAARNLVTGAGARYAYLDGKLIAGVAVGGAGQSITYGSSGSDSAPVVSPVSADLGDTAQFTAHPKAGTLAAGATDIYTFSIRDTEVAAAPSGHLIIRVSLQTDAGIAAPAIDGLTPISTQTSSDMTVVLFAIDTAGLYQLRITGTTGAATGAYTLAVSIAGDVNLSGIVDGADSALAAGGNLSADVNGDGTVNATDLQLIAANYGVAANLPPVVAATPPSFMTHVDLPALIDLSTVASDPNGDPVTYRITGVTHGTAALTLDGRGLTFTPDAEYSGIATFSVVADDGYASSPEATVSITVSSAALTHIDFNLHRILFDTAGSVSPISIHADFADETDVLVAFSYVNAHVDDTSVAVLTPDGLLTSLGHGYTLLEASRGTVANATVVGVGTPADGNLLISKQFDIRAYPSAVTLLPGDGSRQIITSLGTLPDAFVSGTADNVHYISMDSAIASVSPNGMITAITTGTVDIIVIWGYGEDVVHVSVKPAIVGNTVTVGASGGIVQNSDGIRIGIGAGQLSGDTTVSITTVSQADLPLPMVGNGTGAFTFANAFNLDIQGGDLNGPVQIAVPMTGSGWQAGDKVFFFVKDSQPIGPNGEYQDVWAVVDSGTIGSDGMARSSSPPFPGLSTRGSVLVARAAQPLGILRIDLGYQFALAGAFLPLLGLSCIVPGAGLLGLAAYASLAVLPTLYQIVDIKTWRQWANKDISQFDLTANVEPGAAYTKLTPDLPPPPMTSTTAPTITALTPTVDSAGVVTLQMTVTNPGDATKGRIVFSMPQKEVNADPASWQQLSQASPGDNATITLQVPAGVLLGASQVIYESLDESNEFIPSQGVTVANKGGFGFIGDGFNNFVDVLSIQRIDQTGQETIIKQIPTQARVLTTLPSNDLSRVFVGTAHGIDIIDGFTLTLFDHIDINGDDFISALTVDPGTHFLYAAGTGAVYVIDLDPGSRNFDKVIATIHVQAPANGYISSIAENADGTRLFVAAPATEFFGGTKSWTQGGRDPGVISIINTDIADMPQPNQPNTNMYDQVIGTADGFLDTWKIIATTDPTKMLFTSRADLSRGLHTLTITTDTVAGFATAETTIDLHLNAKEVGVSYVANDFILNLGLLGPLEFDAGTFAVPSNDQIVDLDIRNATGVAITPDLKYAFVADYYMPRLFYLPGDYQAAFDIEDLHVVGSKIGIVKDPFGPNPQLLAATTPIPMAFLDQLQLDESGNKLYALFRGAGNIAVYDVTAMEKEVASQDHTFWQKNSLDSDYTKSIVDVPNINLPAIDIQGFSRGLSIQKNAVITLISPQAPQDVSSTTPDQLAFVWKVDTAATGQQDYESNLFVSTQSSGDGLWPDDPMRARTSSLFGLLGSGVDPTAVEPSIDLTDGNPDRIFTSTQQLPDGLKSGHVYYVTVDRKIQDQGEDAALQAAHETKVIFDPNLAHTLTAGQTYYWGVELSDHSAQASQAFATKPVAATSTYGVVTVLTHGFQLGTQLLPTQDSTNLQAPDSFIDLGKLIASADGGGVVLEYNKKTGEWMDVATHAVGVAALKPGKGVVLVSDWVAESDISDTGFSEAAADAMFASLVDLNKQTNGALFGSTFHFIGHSRGTSVNSEIVQRMGTYFPDTKVYMTSLDPHDFNQPSLDIPLQSLMDTTVNALRLAQAVVAATGLVGNAAALLGLRFLNGLQNVLQRAEQAAAALGIQINPIKYSDFKDPDVTTWSNVVFADNYYQTAATQVSTASTISYIINGAAAAVGTIQDPAAAAQAAEQFFLEKKAQIEADAKAALEQLGTAVEADAKALLNQLTDDFVQSAKQALNDLGNKVIADAQARFQQLLNTVQADAQASVQALSNTIASNTQAAATQLVNQAQVTVTAAINQFLADVRDGALSRLSEVTLDNVLPTLADLANFTVNDLQARFQDLIDQLKTLATTSLDDLIQQNKDAVTAALSNLGGQVLSDAQTAANDLANTILTDAQNAFSGLLTIEVSHTEAALQNFVNLVQSDAVTQLTDAATREFNKLKDIAVSQAFGFNTFTATPNGRSVPSANVNESLDQLSGFGKEDFPSLDAGVGGPHSRVWQWYAGTVNTSIQSFQGGVIWRRLSDTGMRATTFGFPLAGQEYSSIGWYFADPKVITGGNGRAQSVAASAGYPIGTNLIKEGVGTGFFFGPDGGGAAYDPQSLNPDPVDLATNNTKAMMDGSVSPPVETVFNGNFEQGTNQSLFNHIYDPTGDWGRFPMSYQLPGWSFHGGGGFKLNASVSLPVLGNVGGNVDLTGLFALRTDADKQLQPVVNSYISGVVDKIVSYLEEFYQNKLGAFRIPPIPDLSAGQTAIDAWNAAFGPNGTFGQQNADAQKFVDQIQNMLNTIQSFGNPLSHVSVLGKTLDQIFALDGNHLFNQSAIDEFKAFLTDNADAILKSLLPSANAGLLFGGASALLTVLKTAFNLSPGSDNPDYQTFVNDILTTVSKHLDFSTLTHNRLYVPMDDSYLNFNMYVPIALTAGTKVEVTIAPDDNGTLDTSTTPLDQAPGAISKTFDIDGAFFHDFAESMSIGGLQGRMALISFKEINSDSSFVGAENSTGTFAGSSNLADAFSSLFILEDVRLGAAPDANEYAEAQQPQIGASGPVAQGTPAGTLTLDDVTRVAAEARANWIASGLMPDAATRFNNVDLFVGLLSNNAIGAYADNRITIDASAEGVGWYTGGDDSEFTAGPDHTLVALTGTDAAKHFDLLTVLEHEYGHALGLPDIPDGLAGGALMGTSLLTGVRILPSAADLPAPQAATPTETAPAMTQQTEAQIGVAPASDPQGPAPLASTFDASPLATQGLANGGFTVADPAASGFGWSEMGSVNVANRQATLSEDPVLLSSLAQSFLLGANEQTLSFTILGGSLYQSAGSAPDAFEVALRDQATGTTLLGPIAALSKTDDLLNLQPDGTLYMAPGVTVSGLTTDGRLDSSAGPHVVTIDVSALDRSKPVSLEFDLVGFGARDSSVQIADVTTGQPGALSAADDTATSLEDAPVLVDVLSNDTGSGLAIQSVGTPSHGSAVIQNGQILYTPTQYYRGADSFTYAVADGSGASATATVHVTVTHTNLPPTLTPVADVAVREGDQASVQLAGADPEGGALSYSLVSGPAGAAVDPATGLFTYSATHGKLATTATVAVTDAFGASAQQTFNLSVYTVAPTLSVTGPSVTTTGVDDVIALNVIDPGTGGALTGWTIDWGDGGTPQDVGGTTAYVTHRYAGAAQYTINVDASNADGVFLAAPLTVAVAPDSLIVTNFTPTARGFHARFDGVLDPASVSSTYESKTPDVVVTGDLVGVVNGSVVLDSDGAGLSFIRSGAPLQYDVYHVTLRSGTVGLHDLRGRQLDGNADGTAGDDYLTTFDDRSNGNGLITVPDFMRGPGQPVNVPASGQGLPVAFTSDGTVKTLVFSVAYDPTLLTISGATAASGLPSGAQVSFATAMSATGSTLARITIVSDLPLPAGTITLVNLIASVPAAALYGSTEVLTLAVEQVNGGTNTLLDDAALHVVGYLGDADGNAIYTSNDTQRILRIVAGADRGFAAWRGINPLLVADIDGNGKLTPVDGSRVGQVATGQSRPEIPALPVGVTVRFLTPQPFISVASEVSGQPGTMVTVPVSIDRPATFSSGLIDLRFNAAVLQLEAVRAAPGSGVSVSVNAMGAGEVQITVTGPAAGQVPAGSLLLLDFQVSATAQPGSIVAIDLAAESLDMVQGPSRPGADGTDGSLVIAPPPGALVSRVVLNTSAAAVAFDPTVAFASDSSLFDPLDPKKSRARVLGGLALSPPVSLTTQTLARIIGTL